MVAESTSKAPPSRGQPRTSYRKGRRILGLGIGITTLLSFPSSSQASLAVAAAPLVPQWTPADLRVTQRRSLDYADPDFDVPDDGEIIDPDYSSPSAAPLLNFFSPVGDATSLLDTDGDGVDDDDPGSDDQSDPDPDSAKPLEQPFRPKLCLKPPSTFDGTDPGFADACAGKRYCSPDSVENATWSGGQGPVTREEIESALGAIQAVQPVTCTGCGNSNILSIGSFGQAAYSASLLFEMTGDLRFLDQMIRFSDNILALRNDPKTGRVMWTGRRELVWPTICGSKGGYAGSEGGMTLGLMVNTAIAILKTPCLQPQKPTTIADDSPTNFTSSDTYLDRALAYVKAADETMDSYYLPHFFDSNDLLVQPNSTAWAKVDSQPAGIFMPYNRRFLVLYGLLKMATVHALPNPSVFNATYSKLLYQLADANVQQFVNDLKPGRNNSYTWTYGATRGGLGGQNRTEEASGGIHGLLDCFGMFFAWQSGLFTDRNVLTRLASSVPNVWNLGNGTFSAFVDGTSIFPRAPIRVVVVPRVSTCTGGSYNKIYTYPSFKLPRPALPGQIALLSAFDPTVYQSMLSGSGFNETYAQASVFGSMLWVKHGLNIQNDQYWAGRFSRNDTVGASLNRYTGPAIRSGANRVNVGQAIVLASVGASMALALSMI